MSEPMSVRVEVWPVAADAAGIWLISGSDAWRPRLPVMADSEPHDEIEMELEQQGAGGRSVLTHSTSWRTDGQAVVLTYVAVIHVSGTAVREQWPTALPIGAALPEAVGKPPTNAASAAPAPRYIDVLMHGLRHLRFLQEHDATAAAALDANWRRHLSTLEPALAGMYDQIHQAS